MKEMNSAGFMRDVSVTLTLLLLVGFGLFWVDPANIVVFQSLGITVFLVVGTHLTRRVLFYRLYLQEIALKAVRENNGSAAIVFASICAVIIAVMYLSMSVLR